jgi:hypothetical protein
MIISKVFQEFSRKFEEAISEAFNLLSQSINARTFFVAQIENDTFTVLRVLNKNGCLLDEGISAPIEDAY